MSNVSNLHAESELVKSVLAEESPSPFLRLSVSEDDRRTRTYLFAYLYVVEQIVAVRVDNAHTANHKPADARQTPVLRYIRAIRCGARSVTCEHRIAFERKKHVKICVAIRHPFLHTPLHTSET